jgi:RecB family exonuclease
MSALDALVAIGKRLAPLGTPDSSMTDKIQALSGFIEAYGRPLPAIEAAARHQRSRGALLSIMERLTDAARLVGDPAIRYPEFREKLHRAIESHTFSMHTGSGGVQVVDARSAGYGSFELVILVGLNEGEWPSRSERNIFYPQWMLKDFGWPTDVDSLAYERAAFVELARLATGSVVAFRHQLEDEIPTVPSPFLEEIEAATGDKRETVSAEAMDGLLVSHSEALRSGILNKSKRLPRRRRPGLLSQPVYDPEPISATAFEMYLRCPFKHYARYVLGLEEEEDLDEGLTPMERGRILHDILQSGFERWDAREAGPRPIVADNYEEAVRLFRSVAEEKLPRSRRATEMEWLFGGAGERGSIEWLLRLEMNRGKLRRRLVEHAFQNRYRLAKGPKGETPWLVQIKGRADRVDVDSDGRLHVFDYKSGRAPESKITVQVPLYALCLSQDFRTSTAEAAYLSLRDKRAVARQDTARAEELVRETYRGMTEGAFPPRPYQDHLCNTCGYLGLCRKEIEQAQAGKEGEVS